MFKHSDTISVDYLDPLNFRCTKLNIGLSRCYTFTTRLGHYQAHLKVVYYKAHP